MLIGVPRPGFFQYPFLHAEIHQFTGLGNPFCEQDVELRLLEGGSHFVLDHLDPHAASHHLLPFFDRLDAANIQADRRVKLQRVAPGGGFRIPEHHTQLHPDLVDEDHGGLRLGNRRSEFAERLGHQARLKPHVLVSHLTLDFGSRHQGRHRVHDNNVHGPAADQRFSDFERLFPGIRLGDQKIVGIDAQFLCVAEVQGMLGIDKGRNPTCFLSLRNRVQRQGRLAGRLWAEDFHDSPTWNPTHTERNVQAQ